MSFNFQKAKPVIIVLILAGVLFLISQVRPGCTVTREPNEVRGMSLGSQLPDGSSVILLRGYYKCHEPARGEIAAFQAPGNAVPVIKVVRGVPGDQFSLTSDTTGGHLLINGNVQTTAEGQPYVLSENRVAFWTLYVNQFHGVIPPKAYMLLGNIPGGALDSIRYGFISSSQLIGKIQR